MSKDWRCFHCDELFTDEAAAREHFGEDGAEWPLPPACRIVGRWQELLVKAIRGMDDLAQHLDQACTQMEVDAQAYHSERMDLERLFGEGVRTAHQAYLRYEAVKNELEACRGGEKKT